MLRTASCRIGQFITLFITDSARNFFSLPHDAYPSLLPAITHHALVTRTQRALQEHHGVSYGLPLQARSHIQFHGASSSTHQSRRKLWAPVCCYASCRCNLSTSLGRYAALLPFKPGALERRGILLDVSARSANANVHSRD